MVLKGMIFCQFEQWPTQLMQSGCVATGTSYTSFILVSLYSPPGHMVDGSEFICGIYILAYFPHWCTLSNFGMWHVYGN